MDVVAHFIERYMQRVLGIRTIHDTILQEQHLPLHTQSADILVKSPRMRLGMHAGDAGNKEYYEGQTFHFRLQKYKNYTNYANYLLKILQK